MKKKKEVKKKNTRKVIKINPIVLLIILAIVIFLTPKFVSTAKYIYNAIHE